MSSPHQIPDAPIEPQVVADFCTGNTRMAAAAATAGQVNRTTKPKLSFIALAIRLLSIIEDWLKYVLMALLDNLSKEQRCRRLKERSDCFDIAMAEEKAPLRDWLQGLLLLRRYRCKADWNSARPKSESPKAGTVSEFNTGKSNGRSNELTENESHPSNADFTGAEHDIKEGKAKTSAAWVAATAAPHHATGNRDLLSGFIIEHDDQFVHAVDGIPMKVLARGAVITDSVVLPDVWFVPGLTENLVSVSQLLELDHSVGFSYGECCVRSTDGKVVGKGHLQEGGLYMLDFLKVPLAI